MCFFFFLLSSTEKAEDERTVTTFPLVQPLRPQGKTPVSTDVLWRKCVYIKCLYESCHIILAKTLDVWRLLHFSVFHLSCIFYQKLTVLLFSHQKMSLDIKSRSTLLNCLSQLWWVSCLLKMNTSCQPSTGWVVPDCGVVCVCARVWPCHVCVRACGRVTCVWTRTCHMPVFSLSDVLENIKHEHHVAQQ